MMCDTLFECINHHEENPMEKSLPATLKLEQKKLLGFRIQTVEPTSGVKHTHKIVAKVGGKAGVKMGTKAGAKPT